MKPKDLEVLKNIIQLEIDEKSRQVQKARQEEDLIRVHRENHEKKMKEEQSLYQLDISSGVGLDQWIRWGRRATSHFERAERQVGKRVQKMVDGLTESLAQKEAYSTVHKDLIDADKQVKDKRFQTDLDERTLNKYRLPPF